MCSDVVVAFVVHINSFACFCNANSIESRYLYVSVLDTRGIINFLALVLFNFVSQNYFLYNINDKKNTRKMKRKTHNERRTIAFVVDSSLNRKLLSFYSENIV